MAPVAASPPPPSDSVDPLSPVLLPQFSSSSPSHFLPRPATPWPHALSNPPTSSPSITSSSDPDYPPLSAVPCRCRSSRRSWSSSPVGAPLASVDPSPSPSTPPSLPDLQESDVQHPTTSLSPPPLVSCAPAVASAAPDGPALLSAPSSLAVSSLDAGLPRFLPPESEDGGFASLSNRLPCPVGPSSSSSGFPSGLRYRPGGLATVAVSHSSLLPSSSKLDSAGSTYHKHDSAGLLEMPSQSLRDSGLPRTDASCSADAPASCPSGSSWASVVGKKAIGGKCPLKFFPPDISDLDNIILSPPPEVTQQGEDLWGPTLVGYFVGNPVHFNVVNYITKKIWKRFELQHVASNESGFFFFRFSSSSMLDKCLANGPWMIAGHPFFLKKWGPGMILAREEHKSFPTWISMSGIPVEYWTPLGLSWIASAVGKPLFLDPVTEKLERLGFARVCVELGVNAPRPNSVKIRTRGRPGELNAHLSEIKIEYQHRPARRGVPEKSRVKSHPIKAS